MEVMWFLLSWLLAATLTSTQADPGARQVKEDTCILGNCIDGGCGQLQNCLLRQEVLGCATWEIAVLAWPKVSVCLHGKNRPCSFDKLRMCYDDNLLKYTGNQLPRHHHVKDIAILPHLVAGYIGQLATNCSLASEDYARFQDCAVGVMDWAQRACEFAMPLTRRRYYYDSRVRSPWKTPEDGIVALLVALNRYVLLCNIDSVTVSPDFGPAAGGTNMSLIRLHTPHTAVIKNVTFGSRQSWCKVSPRFSSITKGVLSCDVQPIGSRSNLIEAPLNIFIHLVENTTVTNITLATTLSTNKTFTYTTDPVVDDVTGLQTPLSGGALVTVRGRGFRSAVEATMEVRLVYVDHGTPYTNTFISLCHIDTDVKILCPVPPLTDPREFPEDLRKRILHRAKYYASGYRRKRSLKATSRGRHKRDTCTTGESSGEIINDNQNLTYLVGVRLDGRMKTADQYKLDVYLDPVLHRFEDTYSLKIYRVYWPFNHRYIEIKGERLTSGLECFNYRVAIGVESCTIEEVSANVLICKPPELEPLPTVYSMHGEPEVQVIIGTGNLRFAIGFLSYEYDIFDHPLLRYILVGGLMVIILVIIAVIICSCCLCRKRKKVMNE